MSLATRCPVCGTTFRVVQDQLKVSEGWVRCGRCDEAFNALEGLFDLERDSVPMGLDEKAVEPTARDVRSMAATEPLPLEEQSDRRAHPEASRSLKEPPTRSKPTSSKAKRKRSADVPRLTMARMDAFDTDTGPIEQPEFLRRAQREARWNSPGVRVFLALACLVLAASLALQWVVHQRDVLAAYRPDWTPALRSVCKPLGCEIQTLRSLQSIVLDSSGLESTDNPVQFRFQTVLRNQSTVSVATPYLDLSLTDARGFVVARKTLKPADFGSNVPLTLAAGGEAPLSAVLDVGSLPVTGYTVLAYYP